MNDKTLISSLTVEELTALIRGIVREENGNAYNNNSKAHVYGIKGIAELFGVSYSKAKAIKASGAIDPAVAQRGRVIVVDSQKALQLFKGRRRNF